MRGPAAAMIGLCALALPARATGFLPQATTILFPPGSAEVSPEARDVLLGFLRPARPEGFRGHCLRGHADRGPDAEALSAARLASVAAVMARQGVNPVDVALEPMGDRAPARLAPAGRAEPMNDRVELVPCPGPRLAGVAEAEARALDAAVVPAFVGAIVPRVARALGCPEPEVALGTLVPPPIACGPEVPVGAVPVISVLRVAGTRRVAVVLEWPLGLPEGPGRWRALAAAGSVLDLFGVPVPPVLDALAAAPGAARHLEVSAGGIRAEVEAGPGLLRRLRVVPPAGDGP